MSMSTLGAQLAAINNAATSSTAAAGASLPTSRRHDDAIGRGLSHSVQVGHAQKSSLSRPSIIYQDAKKAADVPMVTVRENCVSSLRQLQGFDDAFGSFIDSLCKNPKERGLLTSAENDRVDKQIQDLLYRLSLQLSSSSSSSSNNNNNQTVASCLHVMEFLLRKYDLHLRPKTATTALLVFLPQHEQPYFLRLLQLIDLANLPTWSFLRPYAVVNGRVARQILAKQVAKDTALLRHVCQLTQRHAQLLLLLLHNEGGGSVAAATTSTSTSSLSFTAALLVEAMTLQLQTMGSIDERTCQAILPYCVAACKSETPVLEYIHWGHVIASTIVECCILAAEPRQVLVTSVLQGLANVVTPSTVIRGIFSTSSTTTSTISPMMRKRKVDEILNNGLLVALTILVQPLDDAECHRLKVGMNGSSTTSSSGNGTPAVYYGCTLDKTILHALCKLDDVDSKSNATTLADRLGRLQDEYLEVRHWIASLLVFGWSRVVQKSKKHPKKIGQLLLNLIQNERLQKGLWKINNGAWVQSYCSHVIVTTMAASAKKGNDNDDDDDDDDDIEKTTMTNTVNTDFAKKLLQELRRVDAAAYENGVVHALVRAKKKDRSKMASWLGLKKKDSPDGDDDEMMEDGSPSNTIILPPRVALEHADASVRLEAIPRVLEEATNSMDIDGDDDSIQQSLLRRFVADDDVSVALAAAEALFELLDKKKKNCHLEFREDSLEALHKWSEERNVDKESREKLLTNALRICAYMAQSVQRSNVTVLVRLVEGIASYLDEPSSKVAQEAAKSIVIALKGQKNNSKAKDFGKQAKLLLVSDDHLLAGFQRKWSTSETRTEKITRRRFMPMLLKAFTECQKSKKDAKNVQNQASSAVDYCSWAIASFSHDMKTVEKERISECLLETSKNISVQTEKIPTWFHSLAEVNETIFSEVLAAFFKTVSDGVKTKKGDSVPGIAVLLEAALSSSSSTVINNLLQVVSLYVASDVKGPLQYGFVPALALIAHTDEGVRRKAVDIVCKIGELLSKRKGSEWGDLQEASQYVSQNRSSAILGGQKFLTHVLAVVLPSSEKDDDSALNGILGLCVCSMACCFPAKFSSSWHKSAVENSWLEVRQAIGGHNAALSILKAAELAGESACPISARWRYAGKPIIDILMDSDLDGNVPTPLTELVEVVVGMLKAVKATEATLQKDANSSVIISSGPTARGGRSRSYSFGKNDGTHFLKPYPKDMQDSMLSILSQIDKNALTKQIGKTLLQSILCSKSWGEHVFVNLPRAFILEVSSSVLGVAAQSAIDGGEDAFFSLPLHALELSDLLEKQVAEPSYFVSYVSDYISANAERITNDSHGSRIYPILFDRLRSLSANDAEADESSDFARQALTEALLQLVQALQENQTLSSFAKTKKLLGEWVTLLVELVSGENPEIRALDSVRSRRATLQLLTSLCERFPAVVVQKLVPAMVAIVSSATSQKEAKLSSESLSIIVPVYFQHAVSANMSPKEMIHAFLSAAKDVQDKKIRVLLYQSFTDALSRSAGNFVGPFVSSCLAGEAYLTSQAGEESSSLTRLVGQMLSRTSFETRLDSLWTIVNYSRDILVNVAALEESDYDNETMSTRDLVSIVKEGPSAKAVTEANTPIPEDKTVLRLCELLMNSVLDMVSFPAFQKFIRKVDGDAAAPVLRFWQDLLLVQSTYNSLSSRSPLQGTKHIWAAIGGTINEALSSLHNSLPSHIFLAFATSLVKEGENEELRARAVQLVAEGSSALEPSNQEASLYRDMLPFLATMLEGSGNESDGILVRQSSFVAVESIIRLLCIPVAGSSDVRRHTNNYSLVLAKSSSVIETERAALDAEKLDFGSVSTPSKQLICSAALCVATTVRICGPRSLAVLPKLMKSLVILLSAANSVCLSESAGTVEVGEARLVQLSILRALCSFAETLPQFLAPHLKGLFHGTAFPCRALLHGEDDHSVPAKEAAMKLEGILTSHVPARLLIPVASAALLNLTEDDEVLSLLSVLTKSVQNSRGAELAGQVNSLVRAATFGFDHAGVTSLEHPRVVSSTELLTSLILKLSEVQLRSLYTKLREWRGALDKSDPSVLATRRVAFWSLSAGLAKRLKSIYLPCLTYVFSDALDELETSVSALCTRDSARKADGKKKQRLESSAPVETFKHESLLSLQALLLCLGGSLRSDAHNGGAWVREGDSKRFNALLDALSKLLHSRIPSEMSSSLNYQSMVLGEDTENGSVVDCLVALAAAAGEEQLWKPLNHAVLQACSNESRSEVRKAGIMCLHSLIKSIGEEYMVLIPECLPVLSELLEDSDEDIAGLAQDCITLSEELLGESLEDNL